MWRAKTDKSVSNTSMCFCFWGLRGVTLTHSRLERFPSAFKSNSRVEIIRLEINWLQRWCWTVEVKMSSSILGSLILIMSGLNSGWGKMRRTMLYCTVSQNKNVLCNNDNTMLFSFGALCKERRAFRIISSKGTTVVFDLRKKKTHKLVHGVQSRQKMLLKCGKCFEIMAWLLGVACELPNDTSKLREKGLFLIIF